MQTDTKNRLLNTSEALFAERGFYGVSIEAIAKTANAAVNPVY